MEVFTKLTSSLNDLFATQLSDSVSWRTVPGQLLKVTTSAAGFTWGLNAQNTLWVCKEPCTGNWAGQGTPGGGRILDLTADAQNVYILSFESGRQVVRRRPVNGSGSWSEPVNAPADAKTLVATSETLFADTDRGPFKCKAPCNIPSWTALTVDQARLGGTFGVFPMVGDAKGNLTGDPKQVVMGGLFTPTANRVKLTSASSRRPYGVDDEQHAVVYVNGQWRTLPGLGNYTVKSVAGEVDDTAVYAIATDGRVLRCAAPCGNPDDVTVVNTAGHAPDEDELKQLAVNPDSKQVWQLSPGRGSGDGGRGIFNRKDGSPRNIGETVAPIDIRRDNAILDIEARYERALAASETGKILESTTTEVKSARPRMSPEEDPRVKRRELDFTKTGVSIFLLQLFLGTVVVILLVYTVLPSSFAHPIAFVLACVGAGLALAFSGAHE